MALALAQDFPESAEGLNRAAWDVVRKPDASADQYREALGWAELASRLAPDNNDILNTLGVARYRAGRYAEALATLERSDRLHQERHRRRSPEDVVFLAMARHQLGRHAEARDELARLREMLQAPGAANRDVQGFLREAERLISPAPAGPKD